MFANILTLNMDWPVGFPNLAKDLIKQLLKIDPQQRPSLEQILDHPWFKNFDEYEQSPVRTSPLRPL